MARRPRLQLVKRRLSPVGHSGGGDPSSLSLDFSTLPDGAIPGLTGGTWVIASGKAANTPTETEMVSNGNMEAGSPPTGWVADSGVTLSAEGTIKNGGNQSLKIVNTSTFAGAKQTIGLSLGDWYKITSSLYSDGSSSARTYVKEISSPFTAQLGNTQTAAAWGAQTRTNRITNVNGGVKAIATIDQANKTAYADDLSVVKLTLSNLFATKKTSLSDLAIQVSVDPVIYIDTGLVLCLDDPANPKNFLIARATTTTINLDKCVAGVYSNLITSAITGAAAGMTIKVVKSGTSVSLYRNGVQIGTTQTVSDAGIIGNKYHGLFATSALAKINSLSIQPDDTAATMVIASDIHVGGTVDGSSWAVGALDAFVTQLNTYSASAVALLGDLTDSGIQAEIDAYNAAFGSLSPAPYELRGNHDAVGGLAPFDEHFTFAVGDYTFVSFYTTSTVAAPNGEVSAGELTYLEGQLQAAGGKKIVLSHVPVWNPLGTYIDAAYGQAAVMALCETYGVKAVLSGHNHRAGDQYLVNGVYYWDGPAAISTTEGYQVLKLYRDRIELYRYDSRSTFAARNSGIPIIFWV